MRSQLNYLNLIVYTLLLGCILSPEKTTAIELLAQQPIRQSKIQIWQAPAFRHGNNPKSKIQNLKSDDARNRLLEADKLFKTGEEQLQQGELQTALKTFEQVLAIRREIGDKAGESETLFKLAEVYQKLGQNERSQQYYQQAQAIRNSRIRGITIPQGTALRDDNSQSVATETQNPLAESGVAQTPLRDDDTRTGGASAVAQTPLRDDDTRSVRLPTPLPSPIPVTQPTPLRDDNPSTDNASAVAQTPLRDDDTRTGGASAVAQTPLRDDDTRSPTSQTPFRAVTQPTALRDDNSNRTGRARDGSSGASVLTQTPLRDDDTRSRSSQTPLASPGSVAQPTSLRDDDSNLRATVSELRIPESTALRDDDPNRIARVRDRQIQADRLFQTGMQQLQANQLQTALATFQQVLAIRRELGDKIGQGQVLLQLGQVAEKLGRNQQAQDYYRQAREINK